MNMDGFEVEELHGKITAAEEAAIEKAQKMHNVAMSAQAASCVEATEDAGHRLCVKPRKGKKAQNTSSVKKKPAAACQSLKMKRVRKGAGAH